MNQLSVFVTYAHYETVVLVIMRNIFHPIL